ncbi:MAG: hypothetical protein CMK30_01530 [Porticoccaceae bacterium]|nr:hypothetical protein [Porticoccaceae bacterium]
MLPPNEIAFIVFCKFIFSSTFTVGFKIMITRVLTGSARDYALIRSRAGGCSIILGTLFLQSLNFDCDYFFHPIKAQRAYPN